MLSKEKGLFTYCAPAARNGYFFTRKKRENVNYRAITVTTASKANHITTPSRKDHSEKRVITSSPLSPSGRDSALVTTRVP